MYGIIQIVIEDLVVEKFGLDAWAAVKREAGYADIPNGGFIRHESYADCITLNLVAAASKVAGVDAAAVLELFGEFFVHWLMGHGYASMLTSQGATMLDFFNSLDHMHRGLQQGMPQLVAPGFACEGEPGSLVLEYRSQREGFEAMVPGMVRGVGERVFHRRYSCETLHSAGGRGEDGLHRVRFTIRPEGDIATKTLMAQPTPRSQPRRYHFFKHNPAMAHGWVEALQSQVRALSTPADAAKFADNFDLAHLASLLVTPSHEGTVAMTTIFTDPLPHPMQLMPVPSLSYIRGPATTKRLTTAMINSVAMCADVSCGAGALVETSARPEHRLAPVKIQVCVVPEPLSQGILLRALVHTRNEALLNSVGAWSLTNAAWERVRRRFFLNFATDILVLALVTSMLVRHSDQGTCFETWALMATCLKALVEEAVVLATHARRGWLKGYLTVGSLFEWTTLFSYLTFLKGLGLSCVDQIDAVGSGMALFAFVRWCRLPYDFRTLMGLGHTILPIFYTLSTVGPFVLVLSTVLLGFVYSYALLTGEDLAFEHFDLVIGIVYGASTKSSVNFEMAGILIWQYALLSAVTLMLVNLLVGVMSESFAIFTDRADSSFNRERAAAVMRLEMFMWPCRRLSSNKYLRWVQSLVCIEDPGRLAPQDPAEPRRYLWACTPEAPDAQDSEASDLAERIDRVADALAQRLEGLDQRLTRQLAGLEQRLRAA